MVRFTPSGQAVENSSGADLDDPLGYAEHGHQAAAPDDLDAELAKLLDEETGDR